MLCPPPSDIAALQRCLWLLPFPQSFHTRRAEGLDSNPSTSSPGNADAQALPPASWSSQHLSRLPGDRFCFKVGLTLAWLALNSPSSSLSFLLLGLQACIAEPNSEVIITLVAPLSMFVYTYLYMYDHVLVCSCSARPQTTLPLNYSPVLTSPPTYTHFFFFF